MLSKHLTNIIQNLEKKKFREKYNRFKVEGEKVTLELLNTPLKVEKLIAKPEWISCHKQLIKDHTIIEVNDPEMKRISNFKSPPEVIAIAEIPLYEWREEEISQELSVVLNGIQDPGNMGTILRTCAWFGIKNIFCDRNCADIYNPKSIQAAMGSIFRVKTFYVDLLKLIPSFLNKDFLCYGTFLNGENIYLSDLKNRGFIVMGNEGSGISSEIEKLISKRLTIPGGMNLAESLNVGIATGVVLSEFRRRVNN